MVSNKKNKDNIRVNRKSINTEDLCIRHGIIHQPNLRAKLIKFNVMAPVVYCINFIEGRTLSHRQLQEFLSHLETYHDDLTPFFGDVR